MNCWLFPCQSRPETCKRSCSCKKGTDLLKTVGDSSALYLSCKVFREWSTISMRERIHLYVLHFLKQYLTAFNVYVKVWLRNKGLAFFSMKCFLPCRVHTSLAKKW